MKIVAKTLFGLEDVLAAELQALKAWNVKTVRRGVLFEGGWPELYKANYTCRTALRFLVTISRFPIHDDQDLYNKIGQINWLKYLRPDMTIALSATVKSDYFNNSQYAIQKAKDSIVDQLRTQTGRRPDVDTTHPDIRIHLHLYGSDCTVMLDSSGFSLHKRNYRTLSGIAPLNEVLAAGILSLAGWDGQADFHDPMCGSGTFVCEALMRATRTPAGFRINRFGFQNWLNYDEALFKRIREEADSQMQPLTCAITGSDLHQRAVGMTRKNIAPLPSSEKVRLFKNDFFHVPGRPGTVLFLNPPYDERMQSEDILAFYKRIGDTLKQRWSGSEAWILSGHIEALKKIGLKTSRRIHLLNGQIPSKLHKFDMYIGSKSQA